MTGSDYSISDDKIAEVPSSEELEAALTIWKETIEVQMHFNNIEMKIRNLFLTVMMAIVAACGWLIEKAMVLDLKVFQIHFALALLIAGLIASYLFYFMDRYWYHKLLKGAVDQAMALDERYGKYIPALGLTSKITGASPLPGFRRTFWGKVFLLAGVVSPPGEREGKDDLHSNGKIELFYKVPIKILVLAIVIGLFLGGLKVCDQSVAALILSTFS